MFIICKQLNGPVLKSLKTKRSVPKLEKNLAKIFYFFLCRAELGPKFQFLFRAARAEIFFFTSGRVCSHAGRALKIRSVQTSSLSINNEMIAVLHQNYILWWNRRGFSECSRLA